MNQSAAALLRLIALILGALLLTWTSPAVAGDIHMWKDADGVWHFSDRTGPESAVSKPAIVGEEPAPAATAAPDAGPHFGKGILWEISGRGAASSLLLGTIHSGDARVMTLPTPVRDGLRRSRVFAMEIIPDAAALFKLTMAMQLAPDQDLGQILGEPLYGQVVAAMADQGVPEAMTARFKPWAVLSMLSMPRGRSAEFLDLKLYHTALSAGTSVRGLETPEEQIAVFEGIPSADQVTLLRELLRQRPQLAAMTDRLIELYLERDLNALLAVSRGWMANGDRRVNDDFMKRLNRDRNYRMVERMAPLLDAGNAFIAVGALHLPGSDGLLTLLENRGWRVSPVY